MATGHRIKRRGKEYHAAFSAAERAGPMNYKGYKQLQYADRLRIEGALRTGAKVADIARERYFRISIRIRLAVSPLL